MVLEGVPVWRFNTLQVLCMVFLRQRKRNAQEYGALAQIFASLGRQQEAFDCFLKMSQLSNPVIAKEAEDFGEQATKKYDQVLKSLGFK